MASDRLATQYRAKIEGIRLAVLRRLEALYGSAIDPDAIADSFGKFVEDASGIIAAGQSTVADLAGAYLQTRAAQADVELALEDVADAAGTTRNGAPLEDGMIAIGPMILAAIADGRAIDEAIDFGRSLVNRFADGEVTGAADRVQDDPAVRRQVTGWRGTVQADACDRCQENAGDHGPDWEPYRHGNCGCVVEPIFGEL